MSYKRTRVTKKLRLYPFQGVRSRINHVEIVSKDKYVNSNATSEFRNCEVQGDPKYSLLYQCLWI